MSKLQPACIQRILRGHVDIEVDRMVDYPGGLTPLTRKALTSINQLIPLDYMGSAEFEGGPARSLRRLFGDRAKLERIRFTVAGVPEDFYQSGLRAETKQATLHGWCYPEHKADLIQFVELQAAGKSPDYYLQELTYVQAACFGQFRRQGSDYQVTESLIKGWLDIENGWFLSLDESQADKLAHVLGIGSATPEDWKTRQKLAA